jgi:hypothetical protein
MNPYELNLPILLLLIISHLTLTEPTQPPIPHVSMRLPIRHTHNDPHHQQHHRLKSVGKAVSVPISPYYHLPRDRYSLYRYPSPAPTTGCKPKGSGIDSLVDSGNDTP